MSPNILFLSVLAAMIVGGPAVGGDPVVARLWPGETPGDVGITGDEYVSHYNSEFPRVGRTLLVHNVSTPTVTIYLPEPEHNTGTAMIIAPGGGYHRLFWELEGEEVADWLTSHGMAGIILKYRCPHRPGDSPGVPPRGPLLDAQRALSLIRHRAEEWDINPDRIGIVGISAGSGQARATDVLR